MMPGGWAASAVVPVSSMADFLDIVLVIDTTQIGHIILLVFLVTLFC